MKMNVIDVDDLMIRLNEIGERYSEYCSCQAQFNDIIDVLHDIFGESDFENVYINEGNEYNE